MMMSSYIYKEELEKVNKDQTLKYKNGVNLHLNDFATNVVILNKLKQLVLENLCKQLT